ncbi:MAG: hypothetical protein ACRDZ9_01065 [Acidimicrobiales bacterium]
MSERRDEVLGAALGDLEVPEHGPSFWVELGERLVAGGSGAGSAPPVGADADAAEGAAGDGHPDGRPGPGRPRWWGLGPHRGLLAAAAAVLVVAAVAGVIARPDGDRQVRTTVARRRPQPPPPPPLRPLRPRPGPGRHP